MTYENFTIVEKPRQSNFIDLEKQCFGMLIVLGYLGSDVRRNAIWLCQCECGQLKIALRRYLQNDITTSCGCQKAIKIGNSKRIHGQSDSPTYGSWAMMIQRCTNPKNIGYKDYGGRGITVCPRWRDFANFFEDMGKRPEGTTIDRRDNTLGYTPENCYWATDEEQANNKRNNHYLTFNNKTQTIAQWTREIGISLYTLHRRIQNGWTTEKALTQPVRILRPRATVAPLSGTP